MNVKWEQKDGATVARIEGRIDSANILVFQRALESSLDPDARNVVVDFEKVVFMSSAGLRVVLMLGKQLRKRGAKLAVCSLSAPIREIFAVSNFDRILPTHSSETQAIDALAGDQEPDAGKAGRLRNTIDFDIVGDNLRDIASFTVEKYEYIELLAKTVIGLVFLTRCPGVRATQSGGQHGTMALYNSRGRHSSP